MMQSSTDAQHHHHCQSPRGAGAGGGGGGGGGNGGMAKLSLLSHYAAAVASATPHGFSILGALEQQQQQQQQQQHQHFPPPPTPPPPSHQTHHSANAFQSLLQQGLVLTSAGAAPQSYSIAPPPPQLLQGFMEDLIKLSPPGSPPPNAPAYNLTLLSLLEHKTEQLQALVHSLSQASQHNGGLVQPHAAMAAARIASNISHIALAALGAQPPSPACMPDTPPPPLFAVAAPTPAPPPPPPNPLPLVANHQPMHKNNVENEGGEVSGGAGTSAPVAAPGAASSAPTPAPAQAAATSTATAAGAGGMEDGDSAAGSRDEDDDGEGEELVPGSYDLVEMNAVEILAEHTHFCDKCGKGFKRDANLRMHMRGHGEQYKSPAALARPDKLSQDPAVLRPRRYSCPYAGCKRNKKHRKFQPLKTVLCVKNHYRRSHCPKSLTCSKCKSKKFSVVADLKTHEKHCGRDKWQCSCGTTFSRKDKLLGHISLFQGHTPALPLNDNNANADPSSSATADLPLPNAQQDVARHPNLVMGGSSC